MQVIDQARGQVGRILAKFFLCAGFMNRNGVAIHKNAKKKKERGQCKAILTLQAWSIQDLSRGKRTLFSCGTQRVVPRGQHTASLPTRGAYFTLVHLAHSVS